MNVEHDIEVCHKQLYLEEDARGQETTKKRLNILLIRGNLLPGKDHSLTLSSDSLFLTVNPYFLRIITNLFLFFSLYLVTAPTGVLNTKAISTLLFRHKQDKVLLVLSVS